MRALLATMLAALAALALACTAPDDGPVGAVTPTVASTPAGAPAATSATGPATAAPASPPEAAAEPRPVEAVALADVAFERPVDAVAVEDGMLVADQGGVVTFLRDGEAHRALDISGRILQSHNEEGLLSIALDPEFEENGYLWAYSSRSDPRRSVLSRFERIAEDSNVAFDSFTELIVFQVEQPYGNHNGGAVRFGPDGMLYLGLGDGGAAGDPHGHGQDLGTLLGSIVRIDVSGTTEEALYAVPPDNPFVDKEGAAPEIWAYGLRNPWRMSFDPQTGALWVGDVGQDTVEEVSIATAGADLGWNVLEGDRCYQAAECDRSGKTMPVIVYGRDGGRCTVVGGVAARDVEASNLEGAYIFADYCTGELWAAPAAAIDPQSPSPDDVEAALVASGLGNVTAVLQLGREVLVLAFGQPPRVLRNQ